MTSGKFTDDREGYGAVSCALHWVMAALFLWMFASAAMRRLEVENALAGLLWRYHQSIGFVIFVLALVRIVWLLVNLRNRPAHEGVIGRAAVAGHFAIYALMVAIPAVAILRSYGGGRGLQVFGIPVIAPTGVRDAALVAPAAAHGPMGWLLLALVVGHVAMVIVHRVVWKDDVLSRMSPHARHPPADRRA